MNNECRISKWGAIAVCLLISLALAHAAAKPNVVIFYADDLGWGDIRCHNRNPEYFRYTPKIDQFFSDGIEFKNYMTHCVCSPSRAGLLTGMHYAAVGAGPLTEGTLSNEIPNMPKDFQAAGYRTGAFGKWHNSRPNFPADGNGRVVDYKEAKWNELHGEKTMDLTDNIFEKHKSWKWGVGVNAYGFDRWVGYYNGGGDLFDRYVDYHHEVDWWHDRSYRGDEKGYTMDLITKYAIEFIEKDDERPFFCYIPSEAVHEPLQLKRSDLKEFCDKLDTELGIRGQWEYVSRIKSPKSGRLIGDVEELRCHAGEEFDVFKIDPGMDHYEPLIYAAYVYTLDKSIGTVIDRVASLGKLEDTIFFFASDNGATPTGVNLPFRGTKHSLWEGGVHVPAALWWPGKFDKNTKPYAKLGNFYEGLIGYIDIYPTLLSMAGLDCTATELDGKDCWKDLRKRKDCRPDRTKDAFFEMWLNYGTVRTGKWKLYYSENVNQMKLYDMESDVEETMNCAASMPEVRHMMAGLYRDWINDNNYAMSYMPIAESNISHPDPSPAGDILEIKAVQDKNIKNQYNDGVFIRVSDGDGWDKEYDGFVHPGDRVEFDIFVCEDSEVASGCVYVPGKGWDPFYKFAGGLNQDGVEIADSELPKGKWVRQVVGVGNLCPLTVPVNYIALLSRKAGKYHFYMDNIVIRKKDGGIRSVIWQSEKDFASILYVYKGIKHQKLDKALAAKGFPFSDISISVRDAGSNKK